ncbi:MAG: S8 family serine peptidase [Alphaproteobacteria bacterium]|nr:S8 family serine peptidase [Alphaproteobacteria bacterium]
MIDGERDEIATEDDTVVAGISMPFTLIAPQSVTSADSGGDSWGIGAIQADSLDQTAGAGVKIAVLDTGISDHEAFDGLDPVTENFTEEVDQDIDGHGSHCAGTIFGQDVGGRRIGIVRGVRKPLIGKVLGQGGGDSESIMNAILWARSEGASVISMSLGIDFPGFQRRLVEGGMHMREATSIALQAYRDNVRLFDQISRMFSDNTVINAPLLIAASGNESNRPDFTIATAPPAAADDILSVAAVDRERRAAPFSNTLPSCCAPGVDILSADHRGGLKRLSGTSMATPHVAAVAVLEAERLSKSGRFTARELREAVMANAATVEGLAKADGGAGLIMAPGR